MSSSRRWDPVVSAEGRVAEDQLREHLSREGASVLLIAGAGFDPRTPLFAEQLAAWGVNRRAYFVRENRDSSTQPHAAAEAHASRLREAVSDFDELDISIFDAGAVVGGRNIVRAINRAGVGGATDVIVDISALSVGTAFPLVRYLVELHDGSVGSRSDWNLHVVTMHDPALDSRIRGVPAYEPDYVHGFRGGATLDENSNAARLWLPQLTSGQRSTLAALHTFIEPDDTCPILPFPSAAVREGDDLVAEYTEQLIDGWSFDPRNLVLAAEDDPTDLYRTLLTLSDLRADVFREAGGSLLVLSPVGSKVTALGALMAALEHDLPVVYLEASEYEFDGGQQEGSETLIHVWLEGDPYPRTDRPPLRRVEH